MGKVYGVKVCFGAFGIFDVNSKQLPAAAYTYPSSVIYLHKTLSFFSVPLKSPATTTGKFTCLFEVEELSLCKKKAGYFEQKPLGILLPPVFYVVRPI